MPHNRNRDVMTNIEEGYGCVFCDLELATKEATPGGGHYHQVTSTGNDGLRHTKFILCPVKTPQSDEGLPTAADVRGLFTDKE